jgi:hypothetical protein
MSCRPGQAERTRRGIGRIHWLVGRVEDAELPEDHFGLVEAPRLEA